MSATMVLAITTMTVTIGAATAANVKTVGTVKCRNAANFQAVFARKPEAKNVIGSVRLVMNSYIFSVANLFLQRRGSSLGLSPLDWQTISDWEKEGVPLRIVFRSIDDIFDNIEMKPKRLRTQVKSISYCAEEIETAFNNWLALQIGK